jgi:hypothetical protein
MYSAFSSGVIYVLVRRSLLRATMVGALQGVT